MKNPERQMIVVETQERTGQGWAKVFGTLFVIVMTIAIVDHEVTLFAHAIAGVSR